MYESFQLYSVAAQIKVCVIASLFSPHDVQENGMYVCDFTVLMLKKQEM